ncbi:MAG: pitrilysin family protein [Candidatus Pacebacteria bacterium]|nr:pitrilysin family protein [Candidatus Paceibacterota bacterium]
MYHFKLTKFNNGLRVLTVPSKQSLSFQIMVLVNTGADFETKENNGISHFLEHMCFKGTKKRPTNLDITRELDSIGGSYNAFTGSEYTGYYAKVAKQNKDIALDVVSDIFLNSQFPLKEINKEKGVIIEEINMRQDDPKRYIWDVWGELLYENQPAGRPIVGNKENIKRFKREDLIKYCESQYRAGSILILASGNFSEKEIVKQIHRSFRAIRSGQGKAKEKIQEKQTKPGVSLEYKKTDQSHLVLGFRGINLFDKRKYALRVLDTIFDGGMSGILFQTIREKLGVAYYVGSIMALYSDYGFWAVKAGVDNSRLEEVIKVTLKEWKKFKTKLVGGKEFKKAKDFIAGRVALSLENVHDAAEDIAFQELLQNQIETPEQYLRKIKEVTSRDVQKVAQDLLTSQSLNLALIGPHKNKEKLEKLLYV